MKNQIKNVTKFNKILRKIRMSKNLGEITQKMRAFVLWEAGHRNPKSMLRRGKIPIRSAERYISEFRDGENWERKPYSKRTKPQQTRRIIRKFLQKPKTEERSTL